MPDKAFTLKALEQLKVAKTFTDNTQRVNSMSFSPNGEYLVTGSDDESIRLYNCTYATYVISTRLCAGMDPAASLSVNAFNSFILTYAFFLYSQEPESNI